MKCSDCKFYVPQTDRYGNYFDGKCVCPALAEMVGITYVIGCEEACGKLERRDSE